MAKLSKEKRDRLILVFLGAGALIVGLWQGVIKTRQTHLADSRTRLMAAMDKLEKATTRVRHAAGVAADLEVARKNLAAVEDTMASGVDLYSWAILLMEKARTGHAVNVIDVTRPTKGDVGMLAQFPYDAAIFTVRGSAHYHDFGKFLADFENRFPYFRVQNLLLGPGSEGPADSETSGARSGEEKVIFKLDIITLIKPNQ
jgi:hypothetical protein